MSADPASLPRARRRALTGFDAAARSRLAESHVVVIGSTGLDSTILPALAAAGVGRLTIVDDVDEARPRLVGSAEMLMALSPDTKVEAVFESFGPGTSFDLLLEADLLIDASEDPATRYHANDAAGVRGIPLVWGSVTGDSGQVGVAWDEAGVDYRDLAPETAESPSEPESALGSASGILPTVHAVIGALVATEALKLLTGVGEPLIGRVLTYDALGGGMREVAFSRDPEGARPGSIEERTTIPEPDPARSITPDDLARLLAGPTTRGIHETPPLLLDVRERPEASFVSLPDALLIPLGELPDRLGELDPEAHIVVYCHHGVRSARALEVLEKAGFTHVRHLTGGIDAYAQTADLSLPRY